MSRYSELIQKEVINIKDGCLLGCIRDLEIDECDGKICAIILQGESRFLGLLGSSSECQIPWDKICKIGADIILVETDPEKCRQDFRK